MFPQEEVLFLSCSTGVVTKSWCPDCFTPMVPKAWWSAVRDLSVFGSKHKRLRVKGRARAWAILGQHFWPFQVWVITKSKTLLVLKQHVSGFFGAQKNIWYIQWPCLCKYFSLFYFLCKKACLCLIILVPFLNVGGAFILANNQISDYKAFSKWCARK